MKLGVVGIVIEGERGAAALVQRVLSDYGDYIMGRMGIPDKANSVYVISVIIRAENEIISALSGKLGKIGGVKVKTAVTDAQITA